MYLRTFFFLNNRRILYVGHPSTVCRRAWIDTNMAVNINAENKDTDELPEKIVISLQYDPVVGKLCQSLFRTSAQEPCPRKSLLRYRPPSLYSIYSARNS